MELSSSNKNMPIESKWIHEFLFICLKNVMVDWKQRIRAYIIKFSARHKQPLVIKTSWQFRSYFSVFSLAVWVQCIKLPPAPGPPNMPLLLPHYSHCKPTSHMTCINLHPTWSTSLHHRTHLAALHFYILSPISYPHNL